MEVPPSTTPAAPETNVPVSEGSTMSETPPVKAATPASGQQFELDTTCACIVVVCGACGSFKGYAHVFNGYVDPFVFLASALKANRENLSDLDTQHAVVEGTRTSQTKADFIA